MGLETGTTIAALNAAWPLGTDPRSQGDDHLRLIKAVVKSDALPKSRRQRSPGRRVQDLDLPAAPATAAVSRDARSAFAGCHAATVRRRVSHGSVFAGAPAGVNTLQNLRGDWVSGWQPLLGQCRASREMRPSAAST